MTTCQPGRPSKELTKKRIFPISLSKLEQQKLAEIAQFQGYSSRKLASLLVSSFINGFYRRGIAKPKPPTLNNEGNSDLPLRDSLKAEETGKEEVSQ
jgi:hypothetical protein